VPWLMNSCDFVGVALPAGPCGSPHDDRGDVPTVQAANSRTETKSLGFVSGFVATPASSAHRLNHPVPEAVLLAGDEGHVESSAVYEALVTLLQGGAHLVRGCLDGEGVEHLVGY
jgi:hypothetical protein